MSNVEIINGIPVDWDKFKYEGSEKYLNRSKNSYIGLCEELYKNGHKLESNYINSSIKVLIDFNCNHKPNWILTGNYKLGKRCPYCADKNEKAKENFINEVNKNGHILISEYVNNHTKVLVNYNCGHNPYWITPNNYKLSKKCPKCSGKCPEQYKEDFMQLLKYNGHKLLSEYKGADNKVLIDFNCNHNPRWITPTDYKRGKRCFKCLMKKNNLLKIEKSKEYFLSELKENNHKLLSEYTDSTTKVLIDFNCNHKPNWITPNAYKNGTRCPYCKNKGEGSLYDLLLEIFEEVETQKTYDDLKYNQKLRYDFYLPAYNLLIELDGEHHRKPVSYNGDNEQSYKIFKEQVVKDNLKSEYAKNNNINLLRIEYNSKIELDKWRSLIENKIKEIKINNN